MFLYLISLSNSLFVLILHVPSLSFVEPKIKTYNTLFNLHILLCLYGDAPLSLKNVMLTNHVVHVTSITVQSQFT
jgi:hypothetical protein